jgi:cephalosporin hydroxylase
MYTTEKITRHSDLANNDSLSAYLGYVAQQNPNAYETFYKFIQAVRPKRILEIGTGLGGFSMFLKSVCNELQLDTTIVTYDVNSRQEYKALAEAGVDVRIENIFDAGYTQVNQQVLDYIQSDGVTLVLCDGGYKIGEFNLLSNYIKVGDFIMAHDYAPDSKFFSDEVYKKLWNWHEIQDSNIQDAVDRNKLVSYNADEFVKAVWVCKQKLQ